MPQTSEETLRLAASTAARLRLLQADLADSDAKTRCQHLDDVVEHALSSIRPDQRDAFFDELERLFPTWDRNVEVSEAPGPAPARSATDEKELKDPAFLVARLAQIAPTLSDVQKRVITDRLREAGLAPPAGGGPAWPEETVARLRARLSLANGDLDAARVLELTAVLAEFAASLDQLMWNTWKTVSPRSQIRRPAALAQSLGKFVGGDGEVGRAQVAQDVERLRQLTAAMISAVSQVGRQFAQGHIAKFSPTEITSLATMESGGLLVSKEVKCWRKYVELASAMDESAIETEIMQAIANYAESLMKGLGARSP
ncbi:MAG: hypothetical protein WD749_03310 [Phycisphaerales bacterium]